MNSKPNTAIPQGLGEGPFSAEVPILLQKHLDHLRASAISDEVIKERGYRSVLGKKELQDSGFIKAQCQTPGILMPLWGVDGQRVGYQYRPDNPRKDNRGRPIKYETPPGASNRLDCPPRCWKDLANPNVPLFFTEGAKKADALATAGACAINIGGVWNWKGKNDFGGTTIQADFDHIALKGRKVYLTFDSDILTKKEVKQALERLDEHLKRKGADVFTIYLPQKGDKKTGVDDYLAQGHTLDDVLALAQASPTEKQTEAHKIPVPGFVLDDGTIGEMVVDGKGQRTFIVATTGQVRQMNEYPGPQGVLVPTPDKLVGSVVRFPETAMPYENQARLYEAVKTFIHRFVELPQHFEDIASLYALLTWVHDYLPAIPYLRVIGDWGSGKTRFLAVVGGLCFRPIFASGATTASPIFRILDRFTGTLVLDEADFQDSDMWGQLTKILNNGYRPGMLVLRSEKVGDRWQPEGFKVFGPKIIATRKPFNDEALESRCLSCPMAPLTRDDIPINLPPSFDSEVLALRAQLLTFRLDNLIRLKGLILGNELAEKGLQPRLNELLMPLKVMANGEPTMTKTLVKFVRQTQQALFASRQASPAGRALAALIKLKAQDGELSAKAIAEAANSADEDLDALTAHKVGWVLKSLGFEKTESTTTTRKVALWDEALAKRLAASYGLPPLSPETSSESSRTSSADTKPLSGKSLEDSPPSKDFPENLPDTSPVSGAENLENLEVSAGDVGAKEKAPVPAWAGEDWKEV